MTTDSAAPVRVPNVTAGARSGIDHEVIGADAHEAYAINQDLAEAQPDDDEHGDEPPTLPAVPDDLTTVEALTEWVHDDEADKAFPRALAVLVQEKGSDKPRTTLVSPLERLVLDTLLDGVVTASVTEVPDEVPDETPDEDPDKDPAVSPAPSVVTTGAGEAVQIDGPTHGHIEGTTGEGQTLPDEATGLTGSGQVTAPDGTPVGDGPTY